MRKILALLLAFALLTGCAALAEPAPAPDGWTTEITAHFATVEEGRQLMRDRTFFHNQINEYALVSLEQGYESYQTPELLEKIIAFLGE